MNLKFKNGTTDGEFHDVPLFGRPRVGLSEFIARLAVSVLQSSGCVSGLVLMGRVIARGGKQYAAVVHGVQPDQPPKLLGIPANGRSLGGVFLDQKHNKQRKVGAKETIYKIKYM